MPILIAIVVAVVLIVWYLKMWNKSKANRTAQAEEQRQRHGGQSVLEWNGPAAQGAADEEFGPLLVEVPKKSGGDGALFYEKGLVLSGKRVPYDSLKDVVYMESTPSLIPTPKTAGVMWLYPQKGMAIGINGMTYKLDNATMDAIRTGLGYKHS